MKLRRFFYDGEPLSPGRRMIRGQSARYMSRVLRLRPGNIIVLFDGGGCEFPAEILEVSRQGVLVEVEGGRPVDRESPLCLRLALGLCQPAIMDLIIEKVTELGVTEILPLRTERSQRWLRAQRAVSRQRRWERIAQQASRQSGRNRVPRILPLRDFFEVLHQPGAGELNLIFWEEEASGNLKEILRARPQVTRASVLLGPEGGFSLAEVEEALAAGFKSVSLGRRLLRTETAAIAAVSALQYELGDWGL